MTVDPAEIRRALALFVEPGAVAELRILDAGRDGVVSGYFDDLDALMRAAVAWSGKAPGVYVTLNPIPSALLARAQNRMRSWAKPTTNDHDVLRRRWLPLDFDPRRPSGISATQAEHDAALNLAKVVRTELQRAGWPDALFADSGNGAHLLGEPNDRHDAGVRAETPEAGKERRHDDEETARDPRRSANRDVRALCAMSG